jgi:undecaprenyl-diphosphatase
MNTLTPILLGVIQGMTEWLPISSSGQSMLILLTLFHLEPKAAFSFGIYLHLGTLLAVMLKFRKELKDILKNLPGFFQNLQEEKNKLTSFLIFSTLFNGVVGIPLYKFLEKDFQGGGGDLIMAFIGFFLIITGLSLYLSRKRYGGHKKVKDICFFDMVLAGIAQGFSIFPGISRSGITTSVLLSRNFN